MGVCARHTEIQLDSSPTAISGKTLQSSHWLVNANQNSPSRCTETASHWQRHTPGSDSPMTSACMGSRFHEINLHSLRYLGALSTVAVLSNCSSQRVRYQGKVRWHRIDAPYYLN